MIVIASPRALNIFSGLRVSEVPCGRDLLSQSPAGNLSYMRISCHKRISSEEGFEIRIILVAPARL